MRPILSFAIGTVFGAVALGVLRLVALPPEHTTHYHANFAVFVDGRRLDLTADRFMEDVSRCKADPALMEPRDRVHLHNRDQDVVHVHAGAATWSHLFANLHMGLGDQWMVTPTGESLRTRDGKRLTFVLNGSLITDAANRVIRSRDRLLVSYGSESQEEIIGSRFSLVRNTAGEFNGKFDPGGCGSVREPTLRERLRRAFWF